MGVHSANTRPQAGDSPAGSDLVDVQRENAVDLVEVPIEWHAHTVRATATERSMTSGSVATYLGDRGAVVAPRWRKATADERHLGCGRGWGQDVPDPGSASAARSRCWNDLRLRSMSRQNTGAATLPTKPTGETSYLMECLVPPSCGSNVSVIRVWTGQAGFTDSNTQRLGGVHSTVWLMPLIGMTPPSLPDNRLSVPARCSPLGSNRSGSIDSPWLTTKDQAASGLAGSSITLTNDATSAIITP